MVIVLCIQGRIVGIVVDSVSDVVNLTPEQIQPAPEMGSAVDTDYVTGMGMVGERMLILVDIQKLLSDAGIGVLEELTA